MTTTKKIGGAIGDVRANIDVPSLDKYLTDNVKRVKAPVQVKQFKFGQSNPTYLLVDASGVEFVLRKKPAGQLLSSTAHAVEREFRVLNAIYKHNSLPSTPVTMRVPIPEPIALCEDNSVLGTPFYIMEFLYGRIFEDPRLPEVTPPERKELWLAITRTLATLSLLDPNKLGLDSFAPRTPYFPRQIKSLTKVSTAQSKAVDIETNVPVGPIPYFEEMTTWYQKHLPDETKTGSRIVHGDYKMDNVIFHPTEPRIIGILDWELCTLGSPLADLANLTQPFFVEAATLGEGIKGVKGIPYDQLPVTLEDLQREYCKVSGLAYPIESAAYATSWMFFRLAVILQGIAARYARRQASSEKAAQQGALFPTLGLMAKQVALEGNDAEKGSPFAAKAKL